MNNEYDILEIQNKNNMMVVAVKDENGEVKNRELDKLCYLDDILLCENKIELLDNKIIELNDELTKQKGCVYFMKNLIEHIPHLLLISPFCGILSGAILSGENLVATTILGTKIGLGISVFLFVAGNAVKYIAKKKVCCYEETIKAANNTREEYQEELKDLEQKRYVYKAVYDSHVSLTKKTEKLHAHIENQINDIYDNSYLNKPHRLVLTKKDKK